LLKLQMVDVASNSGQNRLISNPLLSYNGSKGFFYFIENF
jgi:hypothetical protein